MSNTNYNNFNFNNNNSSNSNTSNNNNFNNSSNMRTYLNNNILFNNSNAITNSTSNNQPTANSIIQNKSPKRIVNEEKLNKESNQRTPTNHSKQLSNALLFPALSEVRLLLKTKLKF